jgi:hypothetical protein
MTIKQFHHICRAAAAISNVEYIFVYGSNAILPWLEERQTKLLDVMFADMISMELDLDVSNEGENESLNDGVDGSIGELSSFHNLHDIYAHPNSPKGLFFVPKSCAGRFRFENMGDYKIVVPHYLDLIFSKIMAGREKDMNFSVKMSEFFDVQTEELQGLLSEFVQDVPEKAEIATLNFARFLTKFDQIDEDADSSLSM